MNSPRSNRTILAAAFAATLALLTVGACTVAPAKPDGAGAVRAKLAQLQADPRLAGRAPVAMKDAEVAVRAAETPTDDQALAHHRVVVADRKVDTARAQAESRYAEDQRKALSDERDAARLASRTREAENARLDARDARADAATAHRQASAARTDATAARGEASSAQVDASAARGDADAARTDAAVARDQADSARSDAAVAQRQATDLQAQLAVLNARTTDRGLVVTLGDVLFATGRSALKGGVPSNLDNLGAFLKRYPERTVLIEGHTDSVGSIDSNMDLSQRRADSVKAYLVAQGVAPSRLSVSGKGESSPVAGNESATGRQQNRRVEVIISNAVARQ